MPRPIPSPSRHTAREHKPSTLFPALPAPAKYGRKQSLLYKTATRATYLPCPALPVCRPRPLLRLKGGRNKSSISSVTDSSASLALAVAADCPNLLQGVVVVDALPCLAALYRPDFQPSLEEQTQACNSLLQQLNAMSDEQFIRQQRLSAATLCEDSTRQEALVRWSTASDKRTFAQLYADYANTDLRLRLSAIHVPVLVLLEPSFRRVEPLVREQFAGLPDVRLEYAPQGLHFLMFDARDWFLQQFTAFVHP